MFGGKDRTNWEKTSNFPSNDCEIILIKYNRIKWQQCKLCKCANGNIVYMKYKYFIANAVNGNKTLDARLRYNIPLDLSDYNGNANFPLNFVWKCEFSIKSSFRMRKSNGQRPFKIWLICTKCWIYSKWSWKSNVNIQIPRISYANEYEWVWVFVKGDENFFSTLLVFFPLLSTLLYCILFLHRRYVNGCRCSSNVKPHIMNARINGNPYTPAMQIQFVWMIWTKWSWNHLKSCGEVNLKSICFQTHFTYNILLWPIR